MTALPPAPLEAGILRTHHRSPRQSLSGSCTPSHGNLGPSGSRPSLDWPRLPFSLERPFIVQPDLPRGSHHTCPESEDVISLCSRFWSQPRLLYDHFRPTLRFISEPHFCSILTPDLISLFPRYTSLCTYYLCSVLSFYSFW